jgi:DNA polymerase-3 subunit gamma/tau
VEYTPLSVKYRPRKLEDLVGQPVLVRTLSNAIKAQRVHHAFLFVGCYGCGKTTAARVLAASLNCEKGETLEPCGTCDNCVGIMEGKNADVVELDAPSNGGVEHIRDIRTEASYRAVNSKYKIFIIDECHALSKPAVEAMLKVLEEPPEYVKFILCTTERAKVKPTILTRCQCFKFSLLPWGQIGSNLKKICIAENVSIEDDALKVIAKEANGHMRDGLQNLDMVIAYAGGGKPVTVQSAREALGAADAGLYFQLVDHVLQKSFSGGIRTIQTLLLGGSNVETVVAGLMDHLRTLLVIAACDSTAGIISLSEDEKKKFLHQRQLMKPKLIDDMITNLVAIHRGLFYNVSPTVLFEQFLLKSILAYSALSKEG